MTTVDDQRENVAAFLAASDATPGQSLAEWRQRVSWQKPSMWVDVRVGALRKLLDEHERLISEVATWRRRAGLAEAEVEDTLNRLDDAERGSIAQ